MLHDLYPDADAGQENCRPPLGDERLIGSRNWRGDPLYLNVYESDALTMFTLLL